MATRASRLTTLAAMAGTAASALAGPVTHDVLAKTGDPAPGIADAAFSCLADPRLNNAGSVVFHAIFEGMGVTESNDSALASNRSGSLEIVLREGEPSPFDGNFPYDGFADPAIADTGRIATVALTQLEDPNTPGDVFDAVGITDDRASLGGFAATAVGVRNFVPLFLGFQLITTFPFDGGAVHFKGADFVALDNGIFSDLPGPVTPLYTLGSMLDGQLPNELLDALMDPATSSGGFLAFRATYIDDLTIEPVRQSLLVDFGGGASVIADTDDPAPGAGAARFDQFGATPEFNSGDWAAFYATTSGSVRGVDLTQSGIWAQGGPTHSIAHVGEPALGTTETYMHVPNQFALANTGSHVAFHATLTGPTDRNSAIFTTAEGASDFDRGPAFLLAREGDRAPATASGVTFRAFSEPAMNGSGQAAFLAHLDNGDDSTSRALFATDRAGVLRLVARIGDEFDLAGDGSDVRTIKDVLFEGGDIGQGRQQFNDDEQLVYTLEFEDGSQAIVQSQIACPGDVTTTGSTPADPAYGQPDGVNNLSDLLFFVDRWNAFDPTTDITTTGTATPSDPGYGLPDDTVNLSDLLLYVNLWLEPCN